MGKVADKHIIFLCLAFAISINTSCLKNKAKPPEPIDLTPKLPDATKIGANTFGCYINGELFVAATNSPFAVIAVSCNYNSISENELRIQGSRRNDTIQDNIRFILFVNSIGEYDIPVDVDYILGYTSYTLEYGNCYEYFYNESNSGKIEISHLDTINRIISGYFNFDLIGKDECNSEILKITDGRFDLTY